MLACNKKIEKIDGSWKVIMDVQGQCLPFLMDIKGEKVKLINSDESFDLDLKSVGHGIYIVPLSFDENYLEFKYNGSSIDGFYYKKKKDKITSEMKISGKRTQEKFRSIEKGNETSLAGKWKVSFFDKENKLEKTALAIFEANSEKVIKGSILTKTGDYRFLEGVGKTSKFQLFGFDGQMNFVFDVLVKGNKFEGYIYSGNEWKRKVEGLRDENFSLEDPNSLTKAKSQNIKFNAKNLDGSEFNFDEKTYEGKPVILQIFGSWCPNCLDESKFLKQWMKTGDAIDVIAISFERASSLKKAAYQVERLKKSLGLDYKFVIGSIDKDEVKVLDVLPFLENHMSYPTMIFLTKEKKIHSIHTGFSGPATGIAYQEFITKFNKTIAEIK